MTNLTGQSIGRYHILDQLGEGGMATVYKAYDTRLETDVAVKVIRTENLPQSGLEQALKRFEREAKALAKLTHPNIVPIIDYGEYEDSPYLVMKFLPGGTLKQILKGQPVPWQSAATLLIPIARALDYAHRQGMIHRDVKPSNILITADGAPMLTDFGIAKIIDQDITMDLTGTSATVGTPEYMAPEQVVSKTVDRRADIYALGIVFYEMLTGRRPFEADTPMAVLFKHASEALPRPRQYVPGLPEAVEKVLFKALAKKPEDRFQSMEEFALALDTLVREQSPVEQTIQVSLKHPSTIASSAGEGASAQPEGAIQPSPEMATIIPIEIPAAAPGLKNRFPRAWLLVGLIPVIALLGWFAWRLAGQFSPKNVPPLAGKIPTATLKIVNSPVPVTPATDSPVPRLLPDLHGQTISVALENAYPPFNFIDRATGKGVGWDYDAVAEICRRLNCVPQFNQVTWDGIFPAMQAGKYDMLADGVAVTADRAKIVDFSIPYVSISHVLLVRANEARSIGQLKTDANVRIGTQTGSTNELAAKAYFTGKTIQYFKDLDAAMLALKSSDIDGVVIDLISAQLIMNESKGVYKITGEVSTGNQLAFVFSKKSPLVTQVNDALESMRADGTLDKLNIQWGLTMQISVSDVETICKSDALGCVVFTPGQSVKIGLGAPMTGDNAVFGRDISQAAKMAVRDAGKFKGFTYELVIEDDGGTPDGGAAVAKRFVADPQVVAIAGHIFSGATLAAIPIYEAAGIPMMSPSATNPPLTMTGSKVFNRCVFTDMAQGKFAATYLFNKLSVRYLAILHDGQAYGQDLAKVINEEFTKLGGTVVAYQAITPGESDYSPVLASIASKKPQALFYGGYFPEAVVIVNQMKQVDLTGVIFFGGDGTFGQDFLAGTDLNGEGAYSSSLIPPASDAKARFDADYRSAYDQPPGKLSPFTWTGYDSVAVLIKAIENVAVLNPDGRLYIPRAALVAAVRSTKDYRGVSGTITCDPTGECAASGPTFFIDRRGKWVEAP